MRTTTGQWCFCLLNSIVTVCVVKGSSELWEIRLLALVTSWTSWTAVESCRRLAQLVAAQCCLLSLFLLLKRLLVCCRRQGRCLRPSSGGGEPPTPPSSVSSSSGKPYSCNIFYICLCYHTSLFCQQACFSRATLVRLWGVRLLDMCNISTPSDAVSLVFCVWISSCKITFRPCHPFSNSLAQQSIQ